MKSFIKKFHPFEIALAAAILAAHLYAALSDAQNMPNAWFTRDDAYYYFKVAQNITEGKGSTFDGVNPTNGYHPLWMLVCIPIFFFARYDLILPLRMMLMVMALFNVATSILLFRLARENLSIIAAYVISAAWAFNGHVHYIVYEFGLETPLAAFAVAFFIYKLSQFEKSWRKRDVSRKQIAMLAAVAVVVMLSRLDLVFLAMIGGIWVVFRGTSLRFILPFDLVVVFLSMVLGTALRTGLPAYNSVYAPSAMVMTALAMPVKTLLLYFFGAYRHPQSQPVLHTIRGTAAATAAAGIILLGAQVLLMNTGVISGFPRSAFLLDAGISFALMLALRLAAYWFGSGNPHEDSAPIMELRLNWKKWLQDGLAYYGVLGGALAAYMLLNEILFGTAMPISGQVKRWWGMLGHTVYDSPASKWRDFLGLGIHYVYDAWQPTSQIFLRTAYRIRKLYPGADTVDERYFMAMAGYALLALIVLFWSYKRVRGKVTNLALIPLMAGSGVHILSYTATAYGGAKEWYWVSQMVLLFIFQALLLDLIIKPFLKFKQAKPILSVAALFFFAYQAIGTGLYFKSIMVYNHYDKNEPYMSVLPYLEENTPEGAIIGMTGGGNVGYFIRNRTIMNMDGLINSPQYFEAVKNRQAPKYLYDRGMRIIFASTNLLTFPPYYGQFDPYVSAYDTYFGKNLLYLLPEPKY